MLPKKLEMVDGDGIDAFLEQVSYLSLSLWMSMLT